MNDKTKQLFQFLSFLMNKKFKKGQTILANWDKNSNHGVYINPKIGEIPTKTILFASDAGLIMITKDHNNNDVAWITGKGESVYNNTLKKNEKKFEKDFDLKNTEQ